MALERFSDIAAGLTESLARFTGRITRSQEERSLLNPKKPWLSVIVLGSPNADKVARQAARLASKIDQDGRGTHQPTQICETDPRDREVLK
ncbi:hypothetical protein A2714_00580 [Candidatus Woesebacteria bacterium RIFCSPHIGHO2_01_FULL_38_9]|uniref:Uncharacterized protein n=1 Tax=Candidatus Woesebacteria bacterium RIFCSPHIGHO2_01_FULL_38_9 TaxID=1802492 RepID=A0A1F7Y1Y4_9BACT|nr:MAG: hypothetical protein A2714_00580 [Candidatus Woesebacteria bacterium RIFCSPHIGHO2_01_FULL_38_9]